MLKIFNGSKRTSMKHFLTPAEQASLTDFFSLQKKKKKKKKQYLNRWSYCQLVL